MVKSVIFISGSGKEPVDFSTGFDNEMTISCEKLLEKNIHSFDIEIEFSQPIAFFRNHDYTWADLSQNRVANSFSPKIIRLSNGFYVQANSNHGIWEVSKQRPEKLLWRFHPENSEPLAQYSGPGNEKKIVRAHPVFDDFITPVLLFSEKGAVELSRSKIPFVATACFTDHCDFDTLENLQQQRIFFAQHQVKITKGFFLNHFSKRSDNASWQNEAQELQLWQSDGHELCYHSLSQSIKNKEESLQDFYGFLPPFAIRTWIDHGYQPYNLSLYRKEGIDEKAFAQNISDKKIGIFWNYIDSGTAAPGVLNQLNPKHFTLGSFYEGIKSSPFRKRISLLIKNAIVHFYANEKLIKKYAKLASSFKKKSLFSFVGNVFRISIPLLRLFLSWPYSKTKTYPLAQYQTLFFKHAIAGEKFIIFQTLELLDFAKALDKKSLDAFMDDKGMFIAHTYFSVPMAYHDGKIFNDLGEVNASVADNFEYLGQQIRQQKIWNPTLSELADFWEMFNQVEFQLSGNGQVTIKNATEIPYRNIT